MGRRLAALLGQKGGGALGDVSVWFGACPHPKSDCESKIVAQKIQIDPQVGKCLWQRAAVQAWIGAARIKL